MFNVRGRLRKEPRRGATENTGRGRKTREREGEPGSALGRKPSTTMSNTIERSSRLITEECPLDLATRQSLLTFHPRIKCQEATAPHE